MRKHAKTALYTGLTVATVVCGVFLWQQKDYRLVYAGEKPLIVEVAVSNSERTKGLSYRDELASGHGMLFFLEDNTSGCMWMKEMNFSLDVYWFDKNGEYINGYENLPPSSYPDIYCPTIPATYMLEVGAGELQKLPNKLILY